MICASRRVRVGCGCRRTGFPACEGEKFALDRVVNQCGGGCDEQGRTGRVDVAGWAHRRSECPRGRADGGRGERLHAWMAGNGADAQIDIGVRREMDATVGATVIGRRTLHDHVTRNATVGSTVIARRAGK